MSWPIHSHIANVASSATSHLQAQGAVLRQARIIVQLGHLERSERQHTILDLVLRSRIKPLELRDFDILDAFYRLRFRHKTAQKDSFAETQIVRMKKSFAPIRQHAIAEQVE